MDAEHPSTPNNCAQISRNIFLKVFDFRKSDTMQVYWLTDGTIGEATLVDGKTVERVLGVGLGNVECGMVHRGRWSV